MTLDDYAFRPITFQGVTFPATLMGISILEPVLGITDEDIADWLWRLPICCGVTKSAPADRCARCAQRAADLMLEQRQRVLDGIRDRLATHGFDSESTYRDWLLALQRIVELSTAASGDCFWSAPLHPNDKYKTAADAKRLMDALDRARADLHETGNA
jgi:hypothetical protein